MNVKFTKTKKEAFLKAFAENGLSVPKALDESDTTPGMYYYAIKTDEVFAKSFSDIKGTLTNILYDYITNGFNDPDSRIYYMKLLKPDRIDKILFGDVDVATVSFDIKIEDFVDDQEVFNVEDLKNDNYEG